MAEILKERSELDPQFQWDLTPMYESDAAWEAALESLDADIESLSAFAGKLSDAVTIGAYLDASTEVSRKVERLYCYASQRHDEDTRDNAAQSMYARVGSKYVSRMPTWCLMRSRTGKGRPWRSPAPTLCRLR